MEHLYWRANFIYAYRTTMCCADCGYTETHTASEAYVQLKRGSEHKNIPFRQYSHEVGERMPQLKCIIIETEQQLPLCPVCFDGMLKGTPVYSPIYAPGSDYTPEELEQTIASKKKTQPKPPTLKDILGGL